MTAGRAQREREISAEFIDSVCQRIASGQRVRRSLPGWGRIHVDRQLPYLVVYRRPSDRPDPGTERFATGAAVYLTGTSRRRHRSGLHELAVGVCRSLAAAFGAVVVVELWSDAHPGGAGEPSTNAEELRFRIAVPRRRATAGYVKRLQAELGKITLLKKSAAVTLDPGATPAPRGMRPLLSPKEAAEIGCHLVGIEVGPLYQEPGGATEFPLVRRELQRKLGRALGLTFSEFARTETTHRPRSYHALGRRAMVKAVWEVDHELAEVGASFDLLLLVTPVNTEQAWSYFRRHRYDRTPTFLYRPLPLDPSLLKRRLYSIPIEAVEDPTIAHLFHEQRRQLDRQLSLVAGRETPAFLHDGLVLYGDVDQDLYDLAQDIITRIPPTTRNGGRGRRIDATEFAARAATELEHYRQIYPELGSSVELREDVSSLMVSRGDLLVGRRMWFPAKRVEALLQHEIGTHLVTYVNGQQQPLRLMASGLAGYEALQEGLAVFAEFLTGGLSPARLRLLAARVMASRWLVDGASFLETFRELNSGNGFSKRMAFMVATRIYRSGGFVKDAIYLRGLTSVLDYLGDGGDLSTILAGKVALDQAGVIEELLRRRVLKAPLLRPRYLESGEATARLDAARRGLSIGQLIEGSTR